MKKYYLPVATSLLLFVVTSCNSQQKVSADLSGSKDSVSNPQTTSAPVIQIYNSTPDPFFQGKISEYVRRIFQDKNGNLWFGTNGDGVCRFDGKSLTYLNTAEGFGGAAVRGMVEDGSGNIWFATNGGVTRYDGSRAKHPCNTNTCKHNLEHVQDAKEHDREVAQSFTNYTEADGLGSNQVWCVLMDRAGMLWVGIEGGVGRFNGITFSSFPLPAADLTDFPNAYQAPKLVNCIVEDKTGQLWFGTNGNGIYCYDGKSLSQISEKDGLANNFVQSILEDKTGTFWVATRFGGLSRYDPVTRRFTNFNTKDGLSHEFTWTLLTDQMGKLWIGTAGGGACRYDGTSFTHFTAKEGLNSRHVQSILEDKSGKLWFGVSGGLYRFDPVAERFIHITKSGPWQ